MTKMMVKKIYSAGKQEISSWKIGNLRSFLMRSHMGSYHLICTNCGVLRIGYYCYINEENQYPKHS